jgi:glucokinase
LQSSSPKLVADIGGTNARFALVDDAEGRIREAKTMLCADYPDLVEAINAYLKNIAGPAPRQAVISLATPVSGDRLEMTNHIWSFSVRQSRAALALDSLKVVNDYSALALSLPYLAADECSQVGGGEGCDGQVMAVIGPGTGLGVSAVVPVGNHWTPLQGEGGHVAYGPLNEREADVINIVRRKYDHVSAERLVSGSGLSLLYQSIAELEGARIEWLEPAHITAMAIQKSSAIAEQTVSMFCAILGTVAGNLALTVGARGGIYICGGIVPKLGAYFAQSSFRSRFEHHGRFTRYLEKIPTFVIESRYPALRGAAIALAEQYKYLGITSVVGENP